MTIKKSLFRNWRLIPNIFSAHLPILVRCKTNGAVDVHLTAQLAIRCLIANYCTRWRRSFTGVSKDGRRGWFFLKTSAPLSLMMTYRMSLISGGSISLDSAFNIRVTLSILSDLGSAALLVRGFCPKLRFFSDFLFIYCTVYYLAGRAIVCNVHRDHVADRQLCFFNIEKNRHCFRAVERYVDPLRFGRNCKNSY